MEKKISQAVGILIVTGILGIVTTIIVYWCKGLINLNGINADQMQGFGGFIGGFIGTIFIIATTYLVYLTFVSQKKELEETREILRKQRFEGTFFTLLNVQDQIRNSVTFDGRKFICAVRGDPAPPAGLVSGFQFFQLAKEDFHAYFIAGPELVSPVITCRELNVLDRSTAPARNRPLDRIKYKWKRFFDVYNNQLSHYFRHLYYVISFVQETERDEILLQPDKETEIKARYMFYAGMIQAQMSPAELFLFFYNGLCFELVEPLIKKYKLVENLSIEDLADPGEHDELYGPNTLKSRWGISVEVEEDE